MSERGIAIADAGPLIALSIIGQVALIRILFDAVMIPESVRLEVERGKPRPGWDILVTAPWIEVRQPVRPPAALLAAQMDKGEADALALALTIPGSTLILDDLRARRIASRAYNVKIVGTLGVLSRARRANLIGPVEPAIDALQRAGIHFSDSLIETTLKSVGER